MRPSLLDRADRADLAVLRRVAAVGDPWATVIACLLAPGVVQYDPADPDWPDRDRMVVGDPAAGAALEGGLRAPGQARALTWLDATDGYALAIARGMAAASDADGGVFRVWCLLGEGAAGDGSTWEAAHDARGGSLVVVAVAPDLQARRLREFLGSAGWRVARARAGEPVEVLGGIDHALLPGPPGALVASAGRR